MTILVNAAGCVNACRHCSAGGQPPHGGFYSLTELRAISAVWGPIYPYFEATAHPDFPDILAPNLVGDTGGVLSTTGFGLAQRDDLPAVFQRLRTYGYHTLSFTLHGLENQHDWFVGRKGAFRSIVTAGRRATAAGMRIHWNVFLDTCNLGGIPELLAFGKQEFGVTAWLDIPHHRVSPRLWRYEPFRPVKEGVQYLLSHLDSQAWDGPLKAQALDDLTEAAWRRQWRQQPDPAVFHHPFEPRTWPPGDPLENLTLYLMRDWQLYLDPLCSAPIPLGTLPTGRDEVLHRVQTLPTPLHSNLTPDDAHLPIGDQELLHTRGYSVRYKAISAAIFGHTDVG